ncbi:MAG: rhomboid family intramembrane serine protease [Saccharospirillaceae bacterium]|jgi:membrane associated rhomboid family serine protease|nr:rhomboid family intramembrane serine protease [Thalassolituus sp. HI0120]MCH2040588.1 rhomboid family intramembrane serine protease [Saccharospirillaceae bacterium]
MSHKYCPHCDNQQLQVTHYHSEELDICRRCGGAWFEKGELNSLLSTVDNGEDDADFEQFLGKRHGRTEHLCPTCPEHLHKYQLLTDFDVDVELCVACDGVWVEHADLEKVEHSPRIRTALDELNKKISVKSWLFQALARFPVEYNLKPHRFPIVTWMLLILNTLIFLSYAFSIDTRYWVFEHFASRPADLAAGMELWTPLTATFLHGGFMHLIGNMYFLYVIGDNLEDVLGRSRYLLVYLLGGVGASVISVAMNWNSPIMSVGASGAIAALFGMYLIWFRFASLTFMFLVFQKKLSPLWYFALWLVLDNIIAMVSSPGGVDYWAHIGGFAVGLMIGVSLKDWVYRHNPVVRILADPNHRVAR